MLLFSCFTAGCWVSKMDILNQAYVTERKPVLFFMGKMGNYSAHQKKENEIAYNFSIPLSKRNNVKCSPWHMVEAH